MLKRMIFFVAFSSLLLNIRLDTAQTRSPLVPSGEYYEAAVPDSLDLAERASLAINGLAGTLDVERNYEIYFRVLFFTNPPYLFHDTTGFPTNNPKFGESFPMMRIMSGDDKNLDIEAGMMNAMVSSLGEDGLFYVKAGPQRPWHEGVGHDYKKRYDLDFANVYGNSRLLLAMMAWYQRDKNPQWMNRMSHLAQALSRIAIQRGDYAFYPDSEIGEAFSYARGKGWLRTDEPLAERTGAEGSMFMYHCGPIRALARWYALTGDQEALGTATRLVNFVMKPYFWGGKIEPTGAIGYNRGQWAGHQHAHMAMLRALLDYAIVTQNPTLKSFVRDGYEYARATFGLPRIGMFNESCTIGDMVALAVRLTDAGMGDYWEDVDQYVRNHLVETQLIRSQDLREVSSYGALHEVKSPQESADHVIERSIGIYCSEASVTSIPRTDSGACCTGNATQGLYYAWESILRHRDGNVQVNLFLNRSSSWMDLDSFLPYEGKVIMRNKTAQKLSVRVPPWVDRQKLSWTLNGKSLKPLFVANYAFMENLTKGDVITVEFPLVETTEKYTIVDKFHPAPGREYTFKFKGNTVIDISPRQGKPDYPLYLRDSFKVAQAPLKNTRRFASSVLIDW
ncbi:MAG: glycoside hydrolase family 127 protein [Terriglobia bacterium]